VTKVAVPMKSLTGATSFFKEPNLGWAIFISDNPLIRFMAATASQLSHKSDFRTVSTREEALVVLARMDLTLRDALPQHVTKMLGIARRNRQRSAIPQYNGREHSHNRAAQTGP